MKSTFKRIWNVFTTILVVLVVILAILLAGVRLIGIQPYSVLSGSMEPVYSPGDLIYVKEVDYRELGEGDIIKLACKGTGKGIPKVTVLKK